jgi:hypothetical protein
MKKLLFVAAIAVMALSSCKKDYTCTCVISDSSGYFPTTTTTSAIPNTTKSKAETACESLNSTLGTISTKCDL